MSALKFNHCEAFCLMRYQTEDSKSIEYIWNSRDGVTPFCVMAKDGVSMMQHTNWKGDELRPHHKPQPGDRIFVDLTLEKMKEHRLKQGVKYINDVNLAKDFIESYGSVQAFVDATTIHQGEPDVVIVT